MHRPMSHGPESLCLYESSNMPIPETFAEVLNMARSSNNDFGQGSQTAPLFYLEALIVKYFLFYYNIWCVFYNITPDQYTILYCIMLYDIILYHKESWYIVLPKAEPAKLSLAAQTRGRARDDDELLVSELGAFPRYRGLL